jgi:hypothetical protein
MVNELDMHIDHWWNDTDTEKAKYYQLVPNKLHIVWSRNDLWLQVVCASWQGKIVLHTKKSHI